MKLFKRSCIFFIVCYIACLITKMAMNKFTFNTNYLMDSLFIAIGATLGWTLSTYLMERKNKKN